MGPPKSMHTVPDTNVPRTQTTSPTTPRFHRFLPRWSALWRAHRLTSWPHCRRSGGIALHERPKKRRSPRSWPPLGGNCTTRASDTPVTRPQRASCSAIPPLLPRSAAMRDKRRQTSAISIALCGLLLQTSSICAKKPVFSANKPLD